VNLDEFAQASKRRGWSAEDDVGFHMEVDAALASEQASFRWDFQPVDTVETLVFEIEWVGEGSSLSDIDRDFYRLCGRFAERSQYISRVVERDHVVYDLVAGNGEHGHFASFRVVGPRAEKVVLSYAKLDRSHC
jgi:hypothetical protein